MNKAVFICDFFGDDHRFYHKVECALPICSNGKLLKKSDIPAVSLIKGVPVSGVVSFVYNRKDEK